MKRILFFLFLPCFLLANALNTDEEKSGKLKQKAWQTVQTINRLWAITEDMDSLSLFVHDQMILISPGGVIQGKENIINSYRKYTESAETTHFLESEPFIQLYNHDQTVIISYDSDLKIKDAEGVVQSFRCRDMYTLIAENDRWIAVAQYYSFY